MAAIGTTPAAKSSAAPTTEKTIKQSKPLPAPNSDFYELVETLSDLAPFGQRPVVNLLHYPRLAAGKQDKPPIRELVENVPHDVKLEQAWIGESSLTLPVCKGEEISNLAPIRTGKGIRASMAYIVDNLKTLKDLRK